MNDQVRVARSTTHPAVEDGLADRAILANLRHELRTPINAIIGYSEMLLEDASGEGYARLVPDLQKIHDAGAELLGQVNDILDPTGIEAGKLDVDLDLVGATLRHAMLTPINAVVGYSEMLLEDAADLGGEALARDLQRIHTAAESFLELLEHLASFQNLARSEAAGIDATTIAIDMTTAATSAMIQDVVTTIRSLDAGATSSAAARYGPVLVVDDNNSNRDILSRRLERAGLTVATAANGRQALEMVREQTFDLVLLDIMMPELNGLEVLQRLKSDANLREIPVVMISALGEIDSVVRCLQMGAEDYLPKPFNPVILQARVGACLEKKRLRDQEVAYLRTVNRVAAAAGAVEAGRFDPDSLSEVAARHDELGQLARVFQRMGREVAAREQRLKQQLEELRVEIDVVKQQQQVAEITESDAFRDVLERARAFRSRG